MERHCRIGKVKLKHTGNGADVVTCAQFTDGAILTQPDRQRQSFYEFLQRVDNEFKSGLLTSAVVMSRNRYGQYVHHGYQLDNEFLALAAHNLESLIN